MAWTKLQRSTYSGSISAAARTLDYSQSGVSRMIADLEREWGVQLLERGRRGARLTAEGAMMTLMRVRKRALLSSTAVITGYGRIGQEMAARLPGRSIIP